MAIASISVNPLIYRTVAPLEQGLAHRPRLWRLLNAQSRAPFAGAPPETAEAAVDPQYRAVIIGYGAVGRTVTRLLREQGIEPAIIEMNLTTVQQLRAAGVKAFYGDATLRATLEQAGVGDAGTFILSVSGLRGAEEVIRLAWEINPRIHILARTRTQPKSPWCAGPAPISCSSGEGEVALAMTESVLADLGRYPRANGSGKGAGA